jgi:hemolysin III
MASMAAPAPAAPKPRLRGVLHELGLYASVPLGVALGLLAAGTRAQVSAAIFAGAVVAMFGASALYHRFTWSPSTRLWLRRLDHAGIFGLIAGTYTPFGLLVLHDEWRIVILAIVWGGALVAITLKLLWVDAPKWIAPMIGIGLGWVGAVVFPQIVGRVGVAGSLLLLGGGILYTLGAIVYARRRPDPVPRVFGYHELFHALVIAAVALQYASVAFFVLPLG